jgi:Tol biopolymer transport system component
VTYVVSAGNNNIDAGTRSPSRVAEAITVGATDATDTRAVFSNYGGAVDVFAPGVNIDSAWATDDFSTSLRSGTSSAAGFVAGMAARYLGANPSEVPAAVARALAGNATAGKVFNAGAGSPNRLLYRPMSKLVFQTEKDWIYNTYLVNADGSDLKHLTPNPQNNDTGGVWSPDGSKILFSSIRDGNYEIYVMNSDGTNQKNLTNHPSGDNVGAWSPDGTKIVFSSFRDYNNGPEIYVMNADGTNQTRLTFNTVQDYSPMWSPDGNKIFFYSQRNSTTKSTFSEMYVMNADGTNQTRISFNSGRDSGPTWSPDSTKMAFVSSRDGLVEIYSMNADGTNQRRLTFNTAYDSSPVWSPDGSKIAFISYRDDSSAAEIYVMNPDGSNQTRLTFNSTDDVGAIWSPDGTRISSVSKWYYYLVDADGIYTMVNESAVFLMDANGGNRVQITDSPLCAVGASWQPF